VFFNLFVAAEPSVNVRLTRGTLYNDPSVNIATTAQNCGHEFRPRKFLPVSKTLFWRLVAASYLIPEKYQSDVNDLRAAGNPEREWQMPVSIFIFPVHQNSDDSRLPKTIGVRQFKHIREKKQGVCQRLEQ